MNIPETLRYTETHEWIAADGDIVTVGITDHAQAQLGDVVFVELPAVGRIVAKGETCAVVESVKAAGDIYAPVTGEIVEVNEELSGDPARINQDPYGEAWLFKIRLAKPEELPEAKTAVEYAALVG